MSNASNHSIVRLMAKGYESSTREEVLALAQQLMQANSLYASVLDLIPHQLYQIDTEGRLLFVNQTLADAMRMPVEHILGKTAYDFYPKELADKYRADDRQVMQTRQRFSTIEENIHPQTQQKIYVEVVKTPIIDEANEVVGVQGIFWDVTERVNNERVIKEQNARFAAIAAHQSHEVRRLVATILGLMNILDRSGMSEGNAHILALLEKTVEELDAIIHEIVHLTYNK